MEEPLALHLPDVQREIDAPASANLRRYGWRDAAEVASLLVADPISAKGWLAQEDTVNSLERPVLEFYSPRGLAAPAAARLGENAAALAKIREGALRSVQLSGADAAALQASGRGVGRLLSALALAGRRDPARLTDSVTLLQEAAAEAPERGVIRSWVSASLTALGLDLEQRGDPAQAFSLYQSAVDAWPESVPAQIQLGRTWAMQGRLQEAATAFRNALELNPDSGAAHRGLGKLFREAGEPYQAIGHYREALRIAPGQGETHADLGQCLAITSRPDEALAEFREAMRLDPEAAAPMAFAALLLATHPNPASRNSTDAIRLAGRAAELTAWKDRGILEILAASYAAAGRFDEAVTAERKALDLVSATAEPQMVAEMEAALNLYQRGLTRR
jgi:spermidine synthase